MFFRILLKEELNFFFESFMVQVNNGKGFGKLKPEKRKHIRIPAKGDAYVAFGTNFNKIGKLQDISIGGLSFTYITNIEDSVQDSSIATIFISEIGFYLPDLSSKLIYNFPLSRADNIQYYKTLFIINRCGLQFTAINEYQLDKIGLFMNHYT
jgi:hypothetical protein